MIEIDGEQARVEPTQPGGGKADRPWWPPLGEGLRPRQPVVVIAGGFGSGKSELALNLCMGLQAGGERVRLVDLDIVKPFFRSRQARGFLAAAGIGLVAPEGELFHSDLPIVLPEIRSLLRQPDGVVVIDVGGDTAGSRVLSSLGDAFVSGGYELLVVLNTSRPFTRDVRGLVEMVRGIAAAGGLVPTGLVANTHLLGETRLELVLEGLGAVRETGALLGIPVRMLACSEKLARRLQPQAVGCPVLELRRVLREERLGGEWPLADEED
ncbi:MAG: hypothetical protein HYY25_14760 [Candidatus Wallbacteria bacterium]|nr:hypothetical protein [Candidatus Wallbacteria bacterium]